MFRWYVVNTYSGHENKVKANLEHRIESMGQRQRFRRVVVLVDCVVVGVFLYLNDLLWKQVVSNLFLGQ